MTRADSRPTGGDPLDEIEADESGLSRRLRDERPIPAPGYRGGLRRHLLAASGARGMSGRVSPRVLIAGYLTGGFVLLAVALVGVVGTGPFAA